MRRCIHENVYAFFSLSDTSLTYVCCADVSPKRTHTYMHAYIALQTFHPKEYTNTHIHTYIDTYIDTYIHTSMHAYIALLTFHPKEYTHT